MEAWILDQNATSLAVLDTFQSFIWTDRYRGYGDFEIYMPAETSALSYAAVSGRKEGPSLWPISTSTK